MGKIHTDICLMISLLIYRRTVWQKQSVQHHSSWCLVLTLSYWLVETCAAAVVVCVSSSLSPCLFVEMKTLCNMFSHNSTRQINIDAKPFSLKFNIYSRQHFALIPIHSSKLSCGFHQHSFLAKKHVQILTDSVQIPNTFFKNL